MTELKIDLTKRLQREGRWEAACGFRDRVRRDARQAGKTKREANAEAWERMEREFPPLPNTAQAPAEADDDEFFDDDDEAFFGDDEEFLDDDDEELFDDDDEFLDDDDEGVDLGLPEGMKPGTAALNDDMMWAFNHILSPVTEADAPSGCAWYLRQWGRNPKSRDKFVTLIMKTCLEKKSSDDRERLFSLLEMLSKVMVGLETRCPLCDGVFTREMAEAHRRNRERPAARAAGR